MGGHFKLAFRDAPDLEQALQGFAGTTVCTVLSGGMPLRTSHLKGRLGWIFGAEGKGVTEAIVRRAALKLTIPMARGTESLNVAAAAAICLYEGFQNRNQ
jgi:TrmH family RNA methyltransferase